VHPPCRVKSGIFVLDNEKIKQPTDSSKIPVYKKHRYFKLSITMKNSFDEIH